MQRQPAQVLPRQPARHEHAPRDGLRHDRRLLHLDGHVRSSLGCYGLLAASRMRGSTTRVEQVDDQICRQHRHGDEADDRLDHREVAGADGVHEHGADAGPVEHHLDDDGARDRRADPDRHEGHDRQHGVAKDVNPHDLGLRDALGPGKLHELRIERLEHRGPQQARERGDQQQRRRDRRQHIVLPRLDAAGAHSAGRQPAELHREDRHQHQPDPEARRGLAERRHHPHDMIGEFSPMRGGVDAERERR